LVSKGSLANALLSFEEQHRKAKKKAKKSNYVVGFLEWAKEKKNCGAYPKFASDVQMALKGIVPCDAADTCLLCERDFVGKEAHDDYVEVNSGPRMKFLDLYGNGFVHCWSNRW